MSYQYKNLKSYSSEYPKCPNIPGCAQICNNTQLHSEYGPISVFAWHWDL